MLSMTLMESAATDGPLSAIASGLLVVITDPEAIRAYLLNGNGMLVPGHSMTAYINGLRFLKHDPRRRGDMERSAKIHSEELRWSRLFVEFAVL